MTEQPFREADARAWVVTLALKLLAAIGVYAVVMFLLGYIYASYPLVQERTCTPDLIDRVLK